MAYIISADEIKKTLPGFDPAKSEEFHRQSARLADQAYAKALKERPEPTVILMSGGTASGKSEYVSEYLASQRAIVFDGTLPTRHGAEVKMRSAAKAGKTVEIHAVMPEVFFIAFLAFLNRERKFSDEHFYRTHSGSRRVLLELAQKYPKIGMTIIAST